MKKVVLTVILLFLIQKAPVIAQNLITDSSQSSQLSSPISSINIIDYELPYPGILPDNPLYFLKAIRDRIVSFLINDPLKKAEFDILTSDKRYNASISLVKKNKDDLAVSTISKGNNYYYSALIKLEEAKKTGRDISTYENKITMSLKKHKQVLKEIEKDVDSQYRKELVNEEKRIEEMNKNVIALFLKK